MVDMICGPLCNFRLVFICWDRLTLSFGQLISKVYCCCVRLT